MKKITLIMFALFCTTALFTGCSDDDSNGSDEGNGNGPGNGGSGVTVLPKKISKIVTNRHVLDTLHYKYNSEGRLSTITSVDNLARKHTSTITYASDTITIIGDGYTSSPQIITLKNGRATGNAHYYDNYRSSYVLEYSANGYLSKMSRGEEVNKNGEWIGSNSTCKEFSISDGNLQSLTSNDAKNYSATFEYGNTPNNTNIDLWEFVMNSDDMALLCVMGTRFKNLPSKIIEKYKEDETTIEIIKTLTYEINADNYVTRMTIVIEEPGQRPIPIGYIISHE